MIVIILLMKKKMMMMVMIRGVQKTKKIGSYSVFKITKLSKNLTSVQTVFRQKLRAGHNSN